MCVCVWGRGEGRGGVGEWMGVSESDRQIVVGWLEVVGGPEYSNSLIS